MFFSIDKKEIDLKEIKPDLREILLDIIAIVDTIHDFYDVDTFTKKFLNKYFKKFYLDVINSEKKVKITNFINQFFNGTLKINLLNLFNPTTHIIDVNVKPFKNELVNFIINKIKTDEINLSEINKTIIENFKTVFKNINLEIDENEIIKMRQPLYFLIDDFKNNIENIFLLETIINYFKFKNIDLDTIKQNIKSINNNITYPLTYFDDMS